MINPQISLKVHLDDLTLQIIQYLETKQSNINKYIELEIKRQFTDENICKIISKSISSLVEDAVVDVQKSYQLKQLITQSIEKIIKDKLNE